MGHERDDEGRDEGSYGEMSARTRERKWVVTRRRPIKLVLAADRDRVDDDCDINWRQISATSSKTSDRPSSLCRDMSINTTTKGRNKTEKSRKKG